MEKKAENTIIENDNKENSVDTLKKIEDALAKLEQKEKEEDLKLSELREQSETISKIEEKLKEIPTRELVEESISTGEALNKEKKVSIAFNSELMSFFMTYSSPVSFVFLPSPLLSEPVSLVSPSKSLLSLCMIFSDGLT